MKDTKTLLLGIWSMYVKIFETNQPIGSVVQLPGKIRNSKFIYSALNINTRRKDEDDHLCFWRCLAYHMNQGTQTKMLNKKARDY